VRELVDWLADHVEPYVSFRFLLGLVFTALFFQWIVGNVLWLRDVSRASPAATERDRRLGKIARDWALVLLLRSLSWRNVRANLGILLQIAALTVLAVVLGLGVFAPE
jgi:hypothetical protein